MGRSETFLGMIRRINCIATSFCQRPRTPHGAVGVSARMQRNRKLTRFNVKL